MLLGLVSITFIAFLIWLMATLAVHALPVAAAIGAGAIAHMTGAGFLGTAIVALLAGGVTLGVGQGAFATLKPGPARSGLALLFAVPAGFAGYALSRGILAISVESQFWLVGLSVVAGLAAAAMAWFKLSDGGLALRHDDPVATRPSDPIPQPEARFQLPSHRASWPARARRR
jgi:hypothetical protein